MKQKQAQSACNATATQVNDNVKWSLDDSNTVTAYSAVETICEAK